MAEHRITGELHGRRKTVKVEARDEVEAINRVKSKYPDFEISRQELPSRTWLEASSKSDESLALLKEIAASTKKTEGYVRQFLHLAFFLILFPLIMSVLAFFFGFFS